MKPFLKWVGGKSRITSKILNYFPKNIAYYYEPFVGAGSIFFASNFENNIINDINQELITTYKVVQQKPEKLIKQLKIYSNNHNEEFYYRIRSANFTNGVEIAARFIYLNKTCYCGLYRVNSKGQFNVPMGSYKDPIIFTPESIHDASEKLQNTIIKNVNFLNEIIEFDKYFIYLDPPYAFNSGKIYNDYNFGLEHQIILCEKIKYLTSKGCKICLSNSDNFFIRQLYKDFNINEIQVRRSVNSDTKKRKSVNELVITNY